MRRWLVVITICLLCVLCSCTANTPPVEDTVALHMPESVMWYGGTYNTTIVVMPHDANTLKYIGTTSDCSKLVELSEEKILELNALYDSVTDFSGSEFQTTDTQVTVWREGQVHSFCMDCAAQGELNRYLNELLALSEETGEPYPQKKAERELEAFVERKDTVTTTTAPSVTAPTVPYTGTPLNMPESIHISNCYSGSLDLHIRPEGANAIYFFTTDEGEKTVVLTPEEVDTLNRLYESITDFTNLPTVEPGSEDVTLIKDGVNYRFYSIFTTQVELEQYIHLLHAHYNGSEYDWSVVPRDLLSSDPTTAYTGVALRMPDSISESYCSYDCEVTVKVVQVNANTVKYTWSYDDGDGDGGGPQYVTLSEECILELNALYDAITDFSGETGGTSTYLIHQDGRQYSVGWGGANQWELNRYLQKIFKCDAYGLEEWYMFDELFKPSEE